MIKTCCVKKCSKVTGRSGFKGGAWRHAPPGALKKGGPARGGQLFGYNCQNSLKTRLKYIKTTLKVDSIYKSGSSTQIIYWIAYIEEVNSSIIARI